MRVLVQHRSTYRYPRPAVLGPHLFRLRPCNHTRARIESYRLAIAGPHRLYWQQDPHGNHVARATFPSGQPTELLDVLVEVAVELAPINPFDFLVDPRCRALPFAYPDGLEGELAAFRDQHDPAYALGDAARAFLSGLPRDGDVVDAVVACNHAVAREVRYVIREEAGVWTPEETVTHGRGSCRDSAVLLVAALRSRGLAARFVSGYLIQLADEGMIPDQPRGIDRDVVDLHAWAEVYLPGAGWIGLDATSGLLCGEGHVPLAATASPALASPLDGTSDTAASAVDFSTSIRRLGHEPRPTAPYTDEVWTALLDGADRADAALTAEGLTLTVGGEPTFTSREHPTAAEWNGAALGPSKWTQGRRLAARLQEALAPGGALLVRMGKHYPGEPLPRWAIEIVARRDGAAVWPVRPLPAAGELEAAQRLIAAIAGELGLAAPAGGLVGHPAF
ncbi:MAG TPA: transglutaminase family protein, partial [Kofleriaceae bacterium]|nr:transglutaminase family protein [Kofleriaceae bacterium]